MTDDDENNDIRQTIESASPEAKAIVAAVLVLERDLAHATSRRGLIEEITQKVKEIVT